MYINDIVCLRDNQNNLSRELNGMKFNGFSRLLRETRLEFLSSSLPGRGSESILAERRSL